MSRKNKLPNKEIATQLEISTKAVEKQITKAISHIREHLRKTGLLSILLLFFIPFQK